MSKHAQRRATAKLIRAAASGQVIQGESVPIAWIQAEGDAAAADAPKRFAMNAYSGGAMIVGNYDLPVVIDLAGLQAGETAPILMSHDHKAIVGHADSITIGVSAVKVSGAISGIGADAQEVLATAKNGFPWKASIGALPSKVGLLARGESAAVNGRTVNGPLYIARKSTLQEVSFVAVPADGKTSATVAATAALTKESSMEFQAWIEAMGLDVNELRDDQKAKLQSKYDAEIKAAALAKNTTIEAAAKELKAPAFDLSDVVLAYEKHVATIQTKAVDYVEKIEAGKLSAIQAKAGGEAVKLKRQALEEEWAVPRFEAALVKAAALAEADMILGAIPKGPGIRSGSADGQPQVVEAALCMASGFYGIEKVYKPEVLEAAEAYHRHQGASLQSLILGAAEANGYSGARRIGRGNYGEVMRCAFPPRIQGDAPSTHQLTTMLSTVGNKFLLQGFQNAEQVWREFASTRPVNDFKTVTSYRMLDDMVFEELGPGGEIKPGRAKQESYTNAAKTYAKMFTITRTDIINDDLGAFDTMRQKIGNGSAIKLNNVFWTAFLDDATFFSSDHSNLITTVLGEAGIAAANVKLKGQTDGYDNPIAFNFRHVLLTGATLNPTARKWYSSAEMRDTTASTKYTTSNIYLNQYRPIESAYITSTTAWYLLPIEAGDLATMEVCFLDGVQAPTIESSETEFDQLGVSFRGYFDFGVAQKEWRAAVKSTGAG